MRTLNSNFISSLYDGNNDQPGDSQANTTILKNAVATSSPENVEIIDALDTLIDQAHGGDRTTRTSHDPNIYLIGLSDRQSHFGKIDGILYAEGLGRREFVDIPYPYFSVVSLSYWIDATNRTIAQQEKLKNILIGESFHEVNEGGNQNIRIPVNRFSRLVPFHPDGIFPPEGRLYGRWLDIENIGKLAVPTGLKKTLMEAAEVWHDETQVEITTSESFRELFRYEHSDNLFTVLLEDIHAGIIPGLEVIGSETDYRLPQIKGSSYLVSKWVEQNQVTVN